jgi:hypothetical protein
MTGMAGMRGNQHHVLVWFISELPHCTQAGPGAVPPSARVGEIAAFLETLAEEELHAALPAFDESTEIVAKDVVEVSLAVCPWPGRCQLLGCVTQLAPHFSRAWRRRLVAENAGRRSDTHSFFPPPTKKDDLRPYIPTLRVCSVPCISLCVRDSGAKTTWSQEDGKRRLLP